MRLYNAASCTPSTLRPTVKPDTLKHFLPPPKVVLPTTSSVHVNTTKERQTKIIPDVSKSATSITTESSSPTDQTAPVSHNPNVDTAAIEDLSHATSKESLRDLSQRFSSESFLFDLDVVRGSDQNEGHGPVDFKEEVTRKSSSTMSSHESHQHLGGESENNLDFSGLENTKSAVGDNRGALLGEMLAPSRLLSFDTTQGGQVASTPISQINSIKTWTSPKFDNLATTEDASFRHLLSKRSSHLSDGTEGWTEFPSDSFQPIEHPVEPPQTASLIVNPVALTMKKGAKENASSDQIQIAQEASVEVQLLAHQALSKATSSESPQSGGTEFSSFPEISEEWQTSCPKSMQGVIEMTEMRSSGSSETGASTSDDDELFERIESDPSCDIYRGMLEDGVSLDLVRAEMERDGMLLLDDPRTQSQTKSTRGRNAAWETGSSGGSRGLKSVWTLIEESGSDFMHSVSVDSYEMQTLFGTNENAEGSGHSQGIRVIEPSRANQCDCVLAGIKLTHDDIVSAITDVNHKALTLEQTRDLVQLIPTEDEARALRGHAELTQQPFRVECEKYMSKIIHVPEAHAKLKAMLLMKRFPICVEYLIEDCRALRSACKVILHSESLRQVLGLILHLGNAINSIGGGLDEPASSFRLKSLLQLDVANDTKTTFLEYVAKVLVKSNVPIILPPPTPIRTWSQSQHDFFDLDSHLPELRSLALTPIAASKSRDKADLSVEQETRALEQSEMGNFVLTAYRTTALAYAELEETQHVVESLCRYLGESPHEAAESLRDLNEFLFQLEEAMERAQVTRSSINSSSRRVESIISSHVSI